MEANRNDRRRAGVSLIEVLVIVAILGILFALLLPAVQAARESARQANCKSHLRQLGVGLLNFHSVHRGFPSGGWGRAWIPMPERGIGLRQSGGWVYQALPYLGEQVLHDAYDLVATDDGEVAIATTWTPSPLFNCPSRRPAALRAASTKFDYQRHPRPGGELTVVARGDYAINSGVSHTFQSLGAPTVEDGDSAFFWRYSISSTEGFTGISHMHRAVTLAQVTDGASKTYLGGEKFLEPRHYEEVGSRGDSETLLSGYTYDNHRFGASRAQGGAGVGPATILYYSPLRDTDEDLILKQEPAGRFRFGSAHPVTLHMLYCDGSVLAVGYGVDPRAHYYAAHRYDGGDLSL